METEKEVICAQVSPDLLNKADRLFRNDDDGVFVEVLQNARRAGATRVTVQIEQIAGEHPLSRVTVQDNGRGITKFQSLLTLGGSGWNKETKRPEDPAGMGFYSLCHSKVNVTSGTRSAQLTPEAFLGRAPVEIMRNQEFVSGTHIEFTRPSRLHVLASCLERVAEFCPLAVHVNGKELPRHDFLAGSLYRERIDGIEVGFATGFEYRDWGDGPNWNFYGLCIREASDGLRGFLVPGASGGLSVKTIYMRFNVLETSRVRLQLPERRAMLQGGQLDEFLRRARAAAYRFFQTQKRHVLSFGHWREAKEMGIVLPEASPLLRTWHANPTDHQVESFFGEPELRLLEPAEAALLVIGETPHVHTLEGALQKLPSLRGHLYDEDFTFTGYSWYRALPRLVDAVLFADGVPFDLWAASRAGRPKEMEMEVTVANPGRRVSAIRFPVEVHVCSEDGLEFTAVQNSPWDNDELDGPFDIVDFLIWATFQYHDDCESNSWETQMETHRADIQRKVNEYFRGPRAALLAILRDAISWDAWQYVKQTGVREIRFRRKEEEACCWEIHLIDSGIVR